MEFTKHHKLFERTNKEDMKENNDLDELITEGILISEHSIKRGRTNTHGHQHLRMQF